MRNGHRKGSGRSYGQRALGKALQKQMIVSIFFTKLHTLIFVDSDVIEDFAIPKAFFFKSPRYILGQNELQFENMPLNDNQVGNSIR